MNFSKIIMFIFVILLLFTQNVYCYEIQDFEFKIRTKQLPEFCNDVQLSEGWGKKKSKIYLEKYGDDWRHMHHYCWGVDEVNEALKKGIRYNYFKNDLRYAIKDFDYVLRRIKNNELRILVLSQKARALRFIEDDYEEIKCYAEIIKLNKKIETAYIMVSQIYLKGKNIKGAIEILELGLKYNPESKILKQKLNELMKK